MQNSITKIKEWTQEEAEDIFKRIERNQTEEWFDIDWKLKENYDNTCDSNRNTTQRAISGFANTYGGDLIIGFKDNGELQGTKKKPNIENQISDKLNKKITPEIPEVKAKYYKYKEKYILVIFVPPSKKPLRCDNGVYYYREQSQFLPMTYEMLETKFRRNFDEEKYLFLVRSELKQLIGYCKRLGNAKNFWEYKLSIYCNLFLKSGEKLYQFYKENNLLDEYYKLSELIRIWHTREMRKHLAQGREFMELKEKVESFNNKLGKK